MRIAIASEKDKVTQHFGHCEHFITYDVEENKVVNKESIKNPGHKPGFLPNFLNEQKVNVIISGGMGGSAVDIFNSHNIEVIVGATGETDIIVEQYIKGELKSTGSVCHQHLHEGEC